jgi:hypothetical protein
VHKLMADFKTRNADFVGGDLAADGKIKYKIW